MISFFSMFHPDLYVPTSHYPYQHENHLLSPQQSSTSDPDEISPTNDSSIHRMVKFSNVTTKKILICHFSFLEQLEFNKNHEEKETNEEKT